MINVCWQVIVQNYRNVISLSDTDPLTWKRKMSKSENIFIIKFQFQFEQINSNSKSPGLSLKELNTTSTVRERDHAPTHFQQWLAAFEIKRTISHIRVQNWIFTLFIDDTMGMRNEWTLNDVHSKSGKLSKGFDIKHGNICRRSKHNFNTLRHPISSNCNVVRVQMLTLPYHWFMFRWNVHFVPEHNVHLTEQKRQQICALCGFHTMEMHAIAWIFIRRGLHSAKILIPFVEK